MIYCIDPSKNDEVTVYLTMGIESYEATANVVLEKKKCGKLEWREGKHPFLRKDVERIIREECVKEAIALAMEMEM